MAAQQNSFYNGAVSALALSTNTKVSLKVVLKGTEKNNFDDKWVEGMNKACPKKVDGDVTKTNEACKLDGYSFDGYQYNAVFADTATGNANLVGGGLKLAFCAQMNLTAEGDKSKDQKYTCTTSENIVWELSKGYDFAAKQEFGKGESTVDAKYGWMNGAADNTLATGFCDFKWWITKKVDTKGVKDAYWYYYMPTEGSAYEDQGVRWSVGAKTKNALCTFKSGTDQDCVTKDITLKNANQLLAFAGVAAASVASLMW